MANITHDMEVELEEAPYPRDPCVSSTSNSSVRTHSPSYANLISLWWQDGLGLDTQGSEFLEMLCFPLRMGRGLGLTWIMCSSVTGYDLEQAPPLLQSSTFLIL